MARLRGKRPSTSSISAGIRNLERGGGQDTWGAYSPVTGRGMAVVPIVAIHAAVIRAVRGPREWNCRRQASLRPPFRRVRSSLLRLRDHAPLSVVGAARVRGARPSRWQCSPAVPRPPPSSSFGAHSAPGSRSTKSHPRRGAGAGACRPPTVPHRDAGPAKSSALGFAISDVRRSAPAARFDVGTLGTISPRPAADPTQTPACAEWLARGGRPDRRQLLDQAQHVPAWRRART